MDIHEAKQLRILVADDEAHILKIFQEVLSPGDPDPVVSSEADKLAKKLYGESVPQNFIPKFDLVTCLQGHEAVEIVKKSLEENKPFAVIFLDVRMPPGPDGVRTAEQIRALDPDAEIVIVTGFSDINTEDIISRVQPSHKLLYVKKPFHSKEIYQFAISLSSKWSVERALLQFNKQLEIEIQKRTYELNLKTNDLKEMNTALKVLLEKKQDDREELENSILSNSKTLIEPYILKLKKTKLHQNQVTILTILENNLNDIVSPFAKRLSSKMLSLSPTEVQVANLIKHGKTNKEIADILGVAKRTVEFHRESIRNKFDLKNKKINLKNYLSSIQ
jgi:DNA-binding NarL/FixJ family response regulator